MIDNHGRTVNYVRLAITDRCNLRCFYCMPEAGIAFAERSLLLTYEEMERLVRVLVGLGVDKVRLTGGEPFVRRDFMPFLERLAAIEGIRKIGLTTNGTLTAPHVPDLKRLGIGPVNLSLDTLHPRRFFEITRRDEFTHVWSTLEALMEHGMEVKINMVVMQGRNETDILEMAALTRHLPVSIRFIEEMPFNGEGQHYTAWRWDFVRIVEHLRSAYPQLTKLPDPPNSTAYHYAIPGHRGNIGIIAAYTRTFCGTCNRLRVTPQGQSKPARVPARAAGGHARPAVRHGNRDRALP
jgi:cyclic pyranopterin phosphate synthase